MPEMITCGSITANWSLRSLQLAQLVTISPRGLNFRQPQSTSLQLQHILHSDECNIFSGVFGNAFLHSNISKTLHQWLIKENITHLPMSGFPHLRKICNAGFIVDAEGKNKYLIHSERMALPTLYVSGGKSLLVTQETSFLANRYMKLHQPGFEHKRVVVEGFGHSDLLIGKKSYKNVFPHFLSHMRMVEGGGGRKVSQGSEISWEAFFDRDGGSKVPAFFIFLLALFFFFWTILYI